MATPDFTVKKPTLSSPPSNAIAMIRALVGNIFHVFAVLLTFVILGIPIWIPIMIGFALPNSAGNFEQSVYKAFAVGMTFFLLSGLFYYLIDALGIEISFEWINESRGWLDPTHCNELKKLCDSHDELDHYRLLVLAQGRRFLYAEFQMAKRWEAELKKYDNQVQKMNEKKQRHIAQQQACKNLYNI